MKKRLNVFLLSVLSTILLLPTILAQFNRGQPLNPQSISRFVEDVITNIIIFSEPLFIFILGKYESNELFFSKILLFILLFIILRKVMQHTPFAEDNEKIGLIVSLIISILGIRFIGQNNFLGSIFIQYGVLAIAITAIIPMVLFFYLIQSSKVGTYGRKMFWSMYVIAMTGIWFSIYKQIPPEANYIYLASVAAAIIFIFMDKSIQKHFGLSEFYAFQSRLQKDSIRLLRRELSKLEEDYIRGGVFSNHEYQQRKRDLFKSIKSVSTE